MFLKTVLKKQFLKDSQLFLETKFGLKTQIWKTIF